MLPQSHGQGSNIIHMRASLKPGKSLVDRLGKLLLCTLSFHPWAAQSLMGCGCYNIKNMAPDRYGFTGNQARQCEQYQTLLLRQLYGQCLKFIRNPVGGYKRKIRPKIVLAFLECHFF